MSDRPISAGDLVTIWTSSMHIRLRNQSFAVSDVDLGNPFRADARFGSLHIGRDEVALVVETKRFRDGTIDVAVLTSEGATGWVWSSLLRRAEDQER